MLRLGILLAFGLLPLTLVAALAQEPEEKSGNDTKKVKFTLNNQVDQTAKVYWVDSEGKEHEQGEIAPGNSQDYETNVSHVWRVKIAGQKVGTIRAHDGSLHIFLIVRGSSADGNEGQVVLHESHLFHAKVAEAGATGSALTAAEAEEVVSYHNKVRKDVGVGPLKWSPFLAKAAQEWADHVAETGTFKHRPAKGRHASPYGENGAIESTVLKGAEEWSAEIQDYKAGTPIPQFHESKHFKSLRYTQMVWRDTTEIGVGKAVIKTGPHKGQLVIFAEYYPHGNRSGEKPY